MSEIAAVYADGGVIGRNPSGVGGTWAWCQGTAGGERVLSACGLLLPGDPKALPPSPVTNNVTEFYALAKALSSLPDGWSGIVYSDSKITIGRIFWAWKRDGLPEHWHHYAQRHRSRLGELRPVLLDGHPTKAQLAANCGKRGNPVSIHNCHVDSECQRMAREFLEARRG